MHPEPVPTSTMRSRASFGHPLRRASSSTCSTACSVSGRGIRTFRIDLEIEPQNTTCWPRRTPGDRRTERPRPCYSFEAPDRQVISGAAMPQPLAICIEDLQCSPGSSRYTTCVVVGGGEPGLGVDSRGQLAWRQEGPLACLLCVSLDEQLILLRPEGAPSVRVERAGRSLDVPVGKPVVLLDQDHSRLRVAHFGFMCTAL